MKNSIVIFKKEVASFFNSLVGYMVLIVFIILTGLFFWVFDEPVLASGKANMSLLFQYAPIFFILIIPAITMRSISEEMKSGTIEFLVTKPITDLQIIIGKFLGAAFLVFVTLLPSLIFYWCLNELALDPSELKVNTNPDMLNEAYGKIAYASKLDNGPIIGGYIGLLTLGIIFAAIGILSSAITENQVVAYVFGAFMCFLMYFGFTFFAELESMTKINLAFDRLGLMAHYESISLGVVDTRDIVYFGSLLTLILTITKVTLSLKRS